MLLWNYIEAKDRIISVYYLDRNNSNLLVIFREGWVHDYNVVATGTEQYQNIFLLVATDHDHKCHYVIRGIYGIT